MPILFFSALAALLTFSGVNAAEPLSFKEVSFSATALVLPEDYSPASPELSRERGMLVESEFEKYAPFSFLFIEILRSRSESVAVIPSPNNLSHSSTKVSVVELSIDGDLQGGCKSLDRYLQNAMSSADQLDAGLQAGTEEERVSIAGPAGFCCRYRRVVDSATRQVFSIDMNSLISWSDRAAAIALGRTCIERAMSKP